MSPFFLKIHPHTRLSHAAPGQSLIETIVAISVLTIGIIGGMALAIYSLGSSEGINSQIIAAGLAREGVEIVRNLRDTQWRQAGPNQPARCTDEICRGLTCPGEQLCYSNWLQGPFSALSGTTLVTYYAAFDPGVSGPAGWQLIQAVGVDPTTFRLYEGDSRTYVAVDTGAPTRFYRKIDLQRQENAPFNPNNPRLSVISTVYWTGKNCPLEEDITNMRCKVTAQEYLTNWKNY